MGPDFQKLCEFQVFFFFFPIRKHICSSCRSHSKHVIQLCEGAGYFLVSFFLSQLEKGWGEAQARMVVETAEGQHVPDRHPPRS